MVINLELRDKWLSYSGGKPCFLPIGDNEGYSIHIDTDLSEAAVFAVFKRDDKEQKIILDENGNVDIPLWVLKNGIFNIGLVTDGYASTPLPVYVIGSIINDEGTETEDPPKTQVEQLIKLVNRVIAGQSGVNIKSVYIDSGELIIELSNGNKINTGKCRGSDETFPLDSIKSYSEKLSPSENTALIRSAIEICSAAHIGTLKFPYKKTILCEMPEGETTLFELPSDLTIDLNGSEVSLTANKLHKYDVFKLSYTSCKNSCIKNGKVTGNKNKIYTENGVEYDYDGIKKLTNSTCEWGSGISFGGINNRVENLEISQFRGDGINFSGDTLFRNSLPSSYWQKEAETSIVTKAYWRTAEFKQLSEKICLRKDKENTLPYKPEITYRFYKKVSDEAVTQVSGSTETNVVDGIERTVTFVGDLGNENCFELISEIAAIDGQGVTIPDSATNFKVIVKSEQASNLYSDENTNGYVAAFLVLCSFAAENCFVNNCKISHCGRQGITFGLSQFCGIDGCNISNIHGVSPGAGIDIEEGQTGANHNTIKNCTISKCDYAVIQAHGWNTLIENCVINGKLHTEGWMRGNVIRQCTVNGDARIGSMEQVDMLKPSVFEQNTVFGSLYAKNAVVKDCSVHDSIKLDGESIAFNCRLINISTFCGRFRDCIWTFDDSHTQCTLNKDNVVYPFFELVNCHVCGKNVWFRNHLLKADRIENCEINVKRITLTADTFKNNVVTYQVIENQQTAELTCPMIVDNIFNCTLDTTGYATSGNDYRSALCLKGDAVTVKGNTFITNSATPCVYVPDNCYIVFVENEGKTADGTVNYDIANKGSGYSTKINGFVGASKNCKAYGCAALSEIKRFEKNTIEIAYAFGDLERRTKVLEYAVDGYKNISESLELVGSEIKPKSGVTLPEKILVDTVVTGITWLNGFGGHSEIRSVIILDSSGYQVLRSNAFNGCTGLKSIVLSDSIQQIGSSVFSGCTVLESVDLKNVQSLGVQCFSSCAALKKLNLPSTLTSIDVNAFLDCKNLETVTVEEGFSASLKLSMSTKFTQATLHALIENLADLTGKDVRTLMLGTTNIAKLDDKHKTMLTNKNWTLA